MPGFDLIHRYFTRAAPGGDVITYVGQSFAEPAVAYALDAGSGGVAELVGLPRPEGIPEIAVEQAREQVAALLDARAGEIVFTSGGTEGDNLALFGLVQAGDHLVTSTIEHHAVLHAAQALAKRGVEVTYVRVGASGIVDPSDIERALRPGTVLISIMHANNELGTIQPLAEIGRMLVRIEVGDAQLATLKRGEQVAVRVGARSYTGTVRRIGMEPVTGSGGKYALDIVFSYPSADGLHAGESAVAVLP